MRANRYLLTLRNSTTSETLHFLTAATSKYDIRMKTAAWLESIGRKPRDYKIIGEHHD